MTGAIRAPARWSLTDGRKKVRRSTSDLSRAVAQGEGPTQSTTANASVASLCTFIQARSRKPSTRSEIERSRSPRNATRGRGGVFRRRARYGRRHAATARDALAWLMTNERASASLSAAVAALSRTHATGRLGQRYRGPSCPRAGARHAPRQDLRHAPDERAAIRQVAACSSARFTILRWVRRFLSGPM